MVLKLVKDTRDKVKSVQGSSRGGKVASYLSIGASVAEKVGYCAPAVGMVGGAMKMASNILDPPPKLSHLKEERQKLENMLEGSSDLIREQIRKSIEISERNITMEIQTQFEQSMKVMSSDLKTIETELGPIKNLGRETFDLVLDIRYKQGIEMIDSAYQSFLRGASNFKTTHSLLGNFIFELETMAGCTFNRDNIETYLAKAAKSRGSDEAMKLATYVFIVRTEYLQLVTAFYLFMNDTDKADAEFRLYQEDFEELQQIHEKVFQVEFSPQELAIAAPEAMTQPKKNLAVVIGRRRDEVDAEVRHMCGVMLMESNLVGAMVPDC